MQRLEQAAFHFSFRAGMAAVTRRRFISKSYTWHNTYAHDVTRSLFLARRTSSFRDASTGAALAHI